MTHYPFLIAFSCFCLFAFKAKHEKAYVWLRFVLPGSQEMCRARLCGHLVFLQESVLPSSVGVLTSFHANVCKLGVSQAKIGMVWFTNPNVLHKRCTSAALNTACSIQTDPQGSWFLRISSLPRWVFSRCSLTILYSNDSFAGKRLNKVFNDGHDNDNDDNDDENNDDDNDDRGVTGIIFWRGKVISPDFFSQREMFFPGRKFPFW